ncbi:MAG: radical SAM protein [Candidatus Omnitrophica bacterium]|nr:radical SAM protein [Candidatus Omnitrophota bacterium]
MRILHIRPADLNEALLFLNNGQETRKTEILHVILQRRSPAQSTEHSLLSQNSPIIVPDVRSITNQRYDQKLRETFNELLKRYRPDVIHIHVISGFSVLPILNTASNLNIHKVLTLYDYSFISPRKRRTNLATKTSLERKEYHRRIRYILNQSDAVVCTKPQQKELLERIHGPNSKIIPVHNGPTYQTILKKKTRSLFLKVGHICNSKCLYCVAGIANEPFIDLSLLKNKLEEVSPDYDRVVLTGGEPTMHPRFFELLYILFYLGLEIEIQSNIRIFSSQKIAARIKKFNPKITVCINSHKEDVFDLLADARGAFKQTVRGAINLRQEAIALETKIIMTRQNCDHLRDIISFIKDLGIKSVMLVFPTPMGLARDNFARINPRYEQIIPAIRQALQWGSQQGMHMLTENVPPCILGASYHSYDSQCEGMLDGIYMNISRGLYNCKTERKDIQKVKIPDCNSCRHFFACEGVYREYIKNFGGNEFVPVTV